MATRAIILGTDSGTFWTGEGAEPWVDDPNEAHSFGSPREAWKAAVELKESQAKYSEDSAVELHIRDAEKPRLSRWVTSVGQANNRSALRAQWRLGFKEALPPDLPTPVGDRGDSTHRLADYLRDVDWNALRARHDSPQEMRDALDPDFWAMLASLAARDRQAADTLLERLAPRDVAKQAWGDRGGPDRMVEDHAGADPFPISPIAEVNEISRGRSQEQDDSTTSNSPSLLGEPPETEQDKILPVFVRRHFVRAGDRFYYRQNPDTLAFSIRGESIRAFDNTVSVATAMVEMAESRGWSALKVGGSREFKRMVWAAAAKRGLAVDGYKPSGGERAILAQEPDGSPTRKSENAELRSDGREWNRPSDPLAGLLLDRGSAPYQHEASNSPSYFVSLRQPTGNVVTYWGLDLKRATEASGAEIGDRVQLERLGKQRAQVREPIRNDAGFVIDYETKETERNGWSVTVTERGSPERAKKGADSLALKVVELFTTKRLAALPSEERAKFRELYDQARRQLEQRDRPSEASVPAPNEISRDRNREREVRSR